MSHDYHDALPGYSPAQILHDGCQECEERSQRDDRGISTLDVGNFARAVARAREWNRHGLPDLSNAERPLLSVLWSVQIQMEYSGERVTW